MANHYFSEIKVETSLVESPRDFVGPELPARIQAWQRLTDVSCWRSWLYAIDKVIQSQHQGKARGSCYDVKSCFGPGQIEILRWNPYEDFTLMLQFDKLRLAFSFKLEAERDRHFLILKGQYELSGWKLTWQFVYRLRLHKHYSKMSVDIGKILSSAT